MQKGNISVQTENIFPIIKQFLYSDQEIFLRELVSNAVDATSKLRTLGTRGETGEIGDTTIEIKVDKEAKTLTISDKGIGLTNEEMERYLNQVAFSSAQEFIEKYKEDASIIGHFGLGFYSAFMVASKVEVHSKSFKEGSEGYVWACEGDPSYSIDDRAKEGRGTDVILHISDDSLEYLEDAKISELLEKYCKFLPVEIKFGTKTETSYEGEGEDQKEIKTEVDNIVNNPAPLWKKQPAEISEEEYKAFYNELYPFSQPPLFWIHLNIDYPFNLTGVLYFPKVSNTVEVQKNKIQLYSNQVFVTDEVSAIVPEFLTLLHGVIDSPDIPLNVSRSYLQSDKNVKKITNYITKKVAEKLHDMFKSDRADFEQKWAEMGTFVKYGMLTEEKFHDRSIKFSLLKNTAGEHATLEEYKEKIKANQTDKHDKIIGIYSNDLASHDSYVQSAKSYGYDVLEMDTMIDTHYMQHLEAKDGAITFVRVDSDTVDNIVQKDEQKESVLSEEEQKQVEALFQANISDVAAKVELKALSPDDQPVMITKPEFMRRMKEMSAMQGNAAFGAFPDSYNVVVNSNHPLVTDKVLKADAEQQGTLVKHLYDLALLNQGMLKGAALTEFINKSLNFLK